jgi:hypothetical protein
VIRVTAGAEVRVEARSRSGDPLMSKLIVAVESFG